MATKSNNKISDFYIPPSTISSVMTAMIVALLVGLGLLLVRPHFYNWLNRDQQVKIDTAREAFQKWSHIVARGGVLSPEDIDRYDETIRTAGVGQRSASELLYSSYKNEVSLWDDHKLRLAAEVKDSGFGYISDVQAYKDMTAKDQYAAIVAEWDEFGSDPKKWLVTEEGAVTTFEKVTPRTEADFPGLTIVEKVKFTIPNALRDRFLALYRKPSV